jgi:ribosomal protein S18 acetylase RimI-like enzyme
VADAVRSSGTGRGGHHDDPPREGAPGRRSPLSRDVVVREATTDDAERLGAFLLAAWQDAGADSPGFAGATPDIMAELAEPSVIRARIGPGGRRMFLAEPPEPDGPLLGFAATRPTDPLSVELAGILVASAAAGRGLGSRLVAASVAGAVGDGFAIMTVRTERTNEHAIDFYRGRGFEVVGDGVEPVGSVEVEVVELAMELGEVVTEGS